MAYCCFAQQKLDTLECIFNKANLHKDGYEIKGAIFDIPAAIAAKCDHKRIRIIASGTNTDAKMKFAEHAENEGQIIQGRYEAVPVVNDSGKLEMKMMLMPGGNSYASYTLYLWEEKQHVWEQLYSNN